MSKLRYLRLWMLGLMLWSNPAQAVNPVYTVDVSVDVTDVNASVAREKAMVAANRRVFETVIRKITTNQGLQAMSKFSDEQILNFIKEVSVVSEKTSDVRYIADLQITINEDILRAYMQEKEIESAVGATSKVVIIPIFREFEAETPLLWEDNNLWRKAWLGQKPHNSLVKIVCISDLVGNNAAMDAEKALTMDKAALEEVLLNNNASDVYVADAVYDGIDGLKVRLMSLKNADNAEENILVPGDRNNSEELLARGVETISSKIENKVKTASIAESQLLSDIEVVYNYPDLRNWVETEKLLKSIAYVRNLHVQALGNGKVQFKLEFVGADEKVWAALRDNGLNLKKYDGFYLLER